MLAIYNYEERLYYHSVGIFCIKNIPRVKPYQMKNIVSVVELLEFLFSCITTITKIFLKTQISRSTVFEGAPVWFSMCVSPI